MLRRLREAFRPKPALALQIRALEEMLVLTPTAFELAVCDLLTEMGFGHVKRVGGAGDLSVDIVARDEKGRSVAVQCKRYVPGNRVGSRDVQQFIGMTVTHHKTDRKLYVTTSGFTAAAAELGRKHGVELIDGDRLTRLLLEHRGVPPPPEPSDAQPNITELLDLAAAGVIDLDRIDFQLDPSVLAELPATSDEELEALQLLNEEEARAAGLPFASAKFNPAAGSAPPIDCWRCGGTLSWDFNFGGYHCPGCGRRVAYDGTDFRVINSGDASSSPTPPTKQASRPVVPEPPVLPFTRPDGSHGLMAPPLEPLKTCENCGNAMETVWSLPGYHCWSCGRGEMYLDATTLQVLTRGARQ